MILPKLLIMAEKAFIDSRVTDLEVFILSTKFEEISDKERLLFTRHLSVAKRYSRILADRIEAEELFQRAVTSTDNETRMDFRTSLHSPNSPHTILIP